MLTIWVDADSCPKPVRAIIQKAARRIRRRAVFVADRPLADCTGAFIEMVIVPTGDDQADDEIVREVREGDLVITRDVILASRVVESGCIVIDDRGGVYTEENMRERLSLRNAMTEFREAGWFYERSRPVGPREIQAFANALDTHATRLMQSEH
jgi:uncharacterized protein